MFFFRFHFVSGLLCTLLKQSTLDLTLKFLQCTLHTIDFGCIVSDSTRVWVQLLLLSLFGISIECLGNFFPHLGSFVRRKFVYNIRFLNEAIISSIVCEQHILLFSCIHSIYFETRSAFVFNWNMKLFLRHGQILISVLLWARNVCVPLHFDRVDRFLFWYINTIFKSLKKTN